MSTPCLIDALWFFLVVFFFSSFMDCFFVHYFIVWEDWLPQPIKVIKSKLKEVLIKWNNTHLVFSTLKWHCMAAICLQQEKNCPVSTISMKSMCLFEDESTFVQSTSRDQVQVINLFKLPSSMNTHHLLERESTQERFDTADWPSNSCCCLSLFLISVIGI